ncbi:MAG TPA: peptidase M20, partial [Rhodanobacteraceae bacterium]|nr:peptidase M20 [Rhodanobacteraceae bacterium]
NRTWRPQLAVVGAEGLPAPANAGNVLLPSTTLKLSLRLPPTLTADAIAIMRHVLTGDPPYGAEVRLDADRFVSNGWNAPQLAPWLERSVANASRAAFGAEAAHMGEGGSIPFMGMLGEKFPKAQFLITGVLGPHSNAHGPNEFLHIPTGKKVSQVVASVVAAHANASAQGLT